MERLVDRLVTGDKTSDLVAMTQMLYSLPRIAEQVEALIVMPGLGEDWRITTATKVWNASQHAEHLLIAGIFRGEKTRVQPTLPYLQAAPFNVTRTKGIHIQEHAHHTKEQADWIVQELASHKVTSAALFVSPYHLLRAYCTLLKAFERNGLKPIQLLPMPATVPPATTIPEIGADAWSMVHGEVERIFKYQEMGDVATAEELRQHIDWLWTQPLLKSQFEL